MKPKKMILMISSLLMAVLIMLQPVLAWFYSYRTDFLMVAGDVQLSVEGWAQSATEEDTVLSYHASLSKEFNDFNFKEVSMDNYVAFKFKVTNIETKDAMLSAGFSDFSEYIFENFIEYYNERKTSAKISDDLADKIFTAAETNTAKIGTILDDIYYIDIDGERVNCNPPDRYLWQYSNGQRYVKNIFLPGVVTDSGGTKTESFVELYFIIRSSHDQTSPEEYKKWLCGDDENTGYGQERLANMIGYTWNALSINDREIVDEYLEYFVRCEFESMSTIIDGAALIHLDIKYFEFIGDSVRP